MSQPQPAGPVPALQSEICPHLGLAEDQQTCLAYPSHWNLCYRAQPAAAVRLRQQRQACLSTAHMGCPVFTSEAQAALPAQLRGRRSIAR